MLTLRKENNLYQVQKNGQPLGWIELFRNPYHAASSGPNCAISPAVHSR